jgi:hypothetical protein
MRVARLLNIIAPMLMGAMAFGQATRPIDMQPRSAQQPAAEPSSTQPPADRYPGEPQSVADAARASKRQHESAVPAKVYRNKDVQDRKDAGNSPAENSSTAASTASQTAVAPASPDPVPTTKGKSPPRNAAAFEAQGNVLRNQVRVQKGKIMDIQNHITSLKNQFAAWSADFSQDDEAPLCWTSLHDSPYYKEWCDTGRNLKAQYEASQRQLEQEKARLEQMQEDIRRKGYGNAVYDPD